MLDDYRRRGSNIFVLWLAAIQGIERNQGLANLAPKGGFIAADAHPRVGGGELAFVGVHADVRDYHERAAKPKNAEIVATVPK